MSHYPHYHRRSDDPAEAHFERTPPGMTSEQLDFFTEQTEHAVEKGVKEGVRRYRNNAIIAFALLLCGVLFNVQNIARQSDDAQNRDQAARAEIVVSGQVAVRNSCNFDNRRAKELRGGLTLFLEDHQQLHAQVNQLREHEGLATVPLHMTNIHKIEQGIKDISVRDCEAAANVFSNPEPADK
jgi:hypothetical protein